MIRFFKLNVIMVLVMYMRRNLIIFLLFILIGFTLCGCGSKENDEDENGAIEDKYYDKVVQSTINIYTDTGNYGAGFVFDYGYVVTNYHVIYDASKITVVTYDKKESDSSLIGYDVENDIAVLKFDSGIKPVEFGNSLDAMPGVEVTAIGNPNGDLSFSKVSGKIIDVNKKLLEKIDINGRWIWFDGNAVSGYSGGPVYDFKGRVIGVVNSKYV